MGSASYRSWRAFCMEKQRNTLRVRFGENKIQLVLLGMLCLLIIGLLYFLFPSQFGLFAGLTKRNEATVVITITPSPIISPSEIPTDTPIPVTNSDPIVSCNLYTCGTVRMPKSQCILSGCCEVGNQHIVMTDQNKCHQMQQAYNSPNKQSPINNNQQNNQTNNNSNSNSSGTVSNGYNLCANNADATARNCSNSCTTTVKQDDNICYQAYAAPNAYEGQNTNKYTECTSEVTAKYQTCLNTCEANQKSALQNCQDQNK